MIPAVGQRDIGQLTGDFDVDFDVGPPLGEEGTLGVLSGLRRDVVTKEEEGSVVPAQNPSNSDVIDLIDDGEGRCGDPQSPIISREQRIARARKALGL